MRLEETRKEESKRRERKKAGGDGEKGANRRAAAQEPRRSTTCSQYGTGPSPKVTRLNRLEHIQDVQGHGHEIDHFVLSHRVDEAFETMIIFEKNLGVELDIMG